MSTDPAASGRRRAPEHDTLSGEVELALPEFDQPPAEPFGLLEEWVHTAVEHGVREPYSISLATADASGRPSNRTVLIKRLDARGLMFVTSAGSMKGREMAATPYAAATFYWRETRQQIRLSGPVRPLPPEESDALFAVRPLPAQASAAVSRQSQPLDDPAGLRLAADRLVAAASGPLPRPEGWGGYLIEPDRIEFWHGGIDRLHRRLLYTLDAGQWRHDRLFP